MIGMGESMKRTINEKQVTRCLPTPVSQLRKAGWQKRRNGWKSPYTQNVISEEKALYLEEFMQRNSQNELQKEKQDEL